MSKENVLQNPKTGFLIMTMDRGLWRGKAVYTHKAREGEDFELFNSMVMFRYNAYFGIHTVHYMDLVETYGREGLPYAGIILSLLTTNLGAFLGGPGVKRNPAEQILKPWAEGLFKHPASVKFLSYVGEDGFPVIIPLLQARAVDSGRIVFSDQAYGRELARLRKGEPVAVFGLTLRMEDVLVRGPFLGFDRYRGLRLGAVDIEWVYNSMPPVPGQIYPLQKLDPVVNF